MDCIINPKTERAVKKTSALGKRLLKNTDKTLKEDCVINPKTGRAVRKDSVIGRRILKTKSKTKSTPALPSPPLPPPATLRQTPQDFSITEEEIYIPPAPQEKTSPKLATETLTTPLKGRIKTLKQFGGTCWFNSLIMSMFYSDASRELLLSKYKGWNVDNKIYKTFINILLNQYLKKETDAIEYNMFNVIRPENVLKDLYKYNSKIFDFNPDKKEGNISELYIRKLYEFFGVNVMFLELYIPDPNDKVKLEPSLIYTPYNYIVEEDLLKYKIPVLSKDAVLQELDKDFDVVIIKYVNFPENALQLPSYYQVPKNHKLYPFIKEPKTSVRINSQKFKMDTIGISSVRTKDKNVLHSICGITTKGQKSVYNGWTRQYTDDNKSNSGKFNIPCELMRYNWDIKKDEKFRLGKNCKLTFNEEYDDKTDMSNLQFSFGKSATSRFLYYVKDIPKKETSPPFQQQTSSPNISEKSSTSIYIKENDTTNKYTLKERLSKYKEAKKYLDQISEKECITKEKIGGKNLMTLSNILYMDRKIGSESVYGAIYFSTIKNVPDLYVVSKVTDKSDDNLNEVIIMEKITNDIIIPKKSKHFPLLYTSHLCEERDNRALVSVNELCNGDLKMLMNSPDVVNIKEEDLLNMLFQIFIGFGTFSETLGYYHNDGHWGNILYQNNNEIGYYEYKYKNVKFYLKSCPYNMMVYDFGLSREKKSENDINCIHDFYRISNAFIPADIYRGWNMLLRPNKTIIKIDKIKNKIIDILMNRQPYDFLKILNIIIPECSNTLYKTQLDKGDIKLNENPFIIK